MVPQGPGGSLVPSPISQIEAFVPNPLMGIPWTLAHLVDRDGSPMGPLDSSSIGPRHWAALAKAIADHYAAYTGFVILHGTDTLAYTASALSFLLHGLDKPVVLTGSQKPLSALNSDAPANTINALTVAGASPGLPGVSLCFADVLLRGNRATKVSVDHKHAFDSPNAPPLGDFGVEAGDFSPSPLPLPSPPPSSPFWAETRPLKESVVLLPLTPGLRAETLRHILAAEGVEGYVLRSFGAGNAPEDPAFLAALAEATQAGKVLVNTTQCLSGGVRLGAYGASLGLLEAGVVSGHDMTPEAAVTKLMWLLTTEPDRATLLTKLHSNQRGELTEE